MNVSHHTTTVLLLLAFTVTAHGQDGSGSRNLFTPPSVGTGDVPLPITQDLLPSVGESSVFGTPPHVDLSDGLTDSHPADSHPAAADTPKLISPPGIVSDASSQALSTVSSPLMDSPAQPQSIPALGDWQTTDNYQQALSLWGNGTAAAAPAAPVDAPVSYYLDQSSGASGSGSSCGNSCGSSCGSSGCGNCSSLCGCGPCTWGRFEVLLWTIDGYSVPSLITQSPGSVVRDSAGALGGAGTQVLSGNRELGDDLRIGGRFQFGKWFDQCRRFGIQTDFFGLGGVNQSATFTGNGQDTFARPFFNTNPNVNAQDAQVFALPGLAEGSVRFDTSSEILSAGPALRFNVCCCDDVCNSRSRRVDFLLGYRFFRLEEQFASQEILQVTDPSFVDGTSFELNDSVRTRNDFHGVEFGLNRLTQRGRWEWDLTALVALGEVERVVDLNGTTRINVPGFSDNTFAGGFFVGADEVGRFRDNDFAAIPQVRANVGYCLGRNWRLSAGYNFLFLSSAFRPGQFLDTQIDGAQLGQEVAVDSVQRPVFQRDSLILHGANVGVTYNF